MRLLDKLHVLVSVQAVLKLHLLTIRSPFGGGVHTPELHADNLEGILAQSPGLKVVIPSGPYDAKGLLISSIRSNDPVVYLRAYEIVSFIP